MEQMELLRITIPAGIKEVIREDSEALNIPAYKLYRKIFEEFIYKSAKKRKEIYTRRKRRGT